MDEEKKEEFETKIIDETEKIINGLIEDGIKNENVDILGKLVDIHKDISNECYWKEKEENMRYMTNYGREYGREAYGRRRRDSRGRYMERGVDAKYRGEEMMDEMYKNYQDYSDTKEEYNRGNYGAKNESVKCLEYMMTALVEFMDTLEESANSPEEKELIKRYKRELSEM